MKPNFISVGATCLALGIALGAFGAHGLRDRVGAPELALWETATRYFVIGAFGVLLYGLFDRKSERSAWPGWLLLVGCALFAGSLYALALGGPHILGLVTPFGGLGLITGFLSFALTARRRG
jgi:uncharacterized membrane protein YgdD (TMEM256/DUF423 family)